MSTKNSPLRVIRTEAASIAYNLKALERGERPNNYMAEKLEAARSKPVIKIGLIMDDKVITIEISWDKIRGTSEAAMTEYIMGLMLETRNTIQ